MACPNLIEHSVPLLIGGYPKSGTTLLLALLDYHPQLVVFPEETRFSHMVFPHAENCSCDYVLKETGVHILGNGAFHWPSGWRDYSQIDFAQYGQLVRSYVAERAATGEVLLEAVLNAYAVVTQQPKRKYWVEKTPGNEFQLGRLRRRWPTMRAIYIVRNPLQNFHSYGKKQAAGGFSLTPEKFVLRWLKSLAAWDRFTQDNPNALLMRYEDLVTDPRATLEEVCRFLEIEWNDTLLRPTRNGAFWSGNSMHGEVYQGISPAVLDKYRQELTAEEIGFLETWLAPTMQRFGWPTQARHGATKYFSPHSGSIPFRARMAFYDLTGRAA